ITVSQYGEAGFTYRGIMTPVVSFTAVTVTILTIATVAMKVNADNSKIILNDFFISRINI
ncbi:MAG: hypothetical protein WBL88_09385, partial [Nitrososphaeraceae archaeon]